MYIYLYIYTVVIIPIFLKLLNLVICISAGITSDGVYGFDTGLCQSWTVLVSSTSSQECGLKYTAHCGKPIVKKVYKIIEIVESDRHASTVPIAHEQKTTQKTFWNLLGEVDIKTSSGGGLMMKKTWASNGKWIWSWSKGSESAYGHQARFDSYESPLCAWWDWQKIVQHQLIPYDQALNLDP